jgi:TDG/mug DNA glycosylase family protein
MTPATAFPPIVGTNPQILILGSMPGRKSLVENEYYAHPRNAFWPIMGELFGAGPDQPYARRLATLKKCHIAVWDVLSSCHREGSLDSAIDEKTATVNDFGKFYRAHRSIRRVIFNGAKAADLYRRRVLPDIQLQAPYLTHARLPSTSPAYAAIGFEEKLRQWTVIGDQYEKGKPRGSRQTPG